MAWGAAVTVIIASWPGLLPVSSTHIAAGAGFFREGFTANSGTRLAYVHARSPNTAETEFSGLARRKATRKLVRRAHVNIIAAAWIITVPASATSPPASTWRCSICSGLFEGQQDGLEFRSWSPDQTNRQCFGTEAIIAVSRHS